MSEKLAKIPCLKCGTPLGRDMKFCRSCGSPVRATDRIDEFGQLGKTAESTRSSGPIPEPSPVINSKPLVEEPGGMTGFNLSRAAKQSPETTNGNPDYISETDNDVEQVPKTDSIPPRTLVDEE